MVGYPIGLWDNVHNFPILRRGTTASLPTVEFQGKPHGLIDMAVFPGSSGSPVLVVEQVPRVPGQGPVFGGPGRELLLGILFDGFTYTTQGTIVPMEIPTSFSYVTETQIMIHLARYVRARELLAFRTLL